MTPIDPPEPISFANKLKTLIECVTAQGSLTSTVYPPQSQGNINVNGKEEPPSPQPVPSELDADLIRMLSSEDVMNGSQATSASVKKTSIWNILSDMKNGPGKDIASASHVSKEEDGLMMYAPLEPQSDSQVELATPENVLTEPVDEPGKVKPAQPPNEDSGVTKPTKVVEKHTWVPSTTSLSILTTWWGYRIYLPPPVMAKLDNKTLKATTRAAMITTAVKWLLDKIPLSLVPPQLRPAVKLLKQLSPLAGYIGIFIAWSWDRVRSLDEGMISQIGAFSGRGGSFCLPGNGVVLSATWILPVALLPMTWDAGYIFRPILPPKPEELAEIQEAEKARRDALLDQLPPEG